MHDGYPNRCRFQEMLRFRGEAAQSWNSSEVAKNGMFWDKNN